MKNLMLTTREVAAAENISQRHVRRQIVSGALPAQYTNGEYRVSFASLSPEAQRRYLEAQHSNVVKLESQAPQSAFALASDTQRRRAIARKLIVEKFEAFLKHFPGSLSAAAFEWYAQHKGSLNFRFSPRSIVRWLKAYTEHGIDGLVDGNDGHARRGKTKLQPEAQTLFLAIYQSSEGRVKKAIRKFESEAKKRGWHIPADDAFYRFVKNLPYAIRKARGKHSAAELGVSGLLPYVRREMETPMRTWQSDHHIADVWVSCEGTVCGTTTGCRRGHRPWLTPMYDVGSRVVLSCEISLLHPNSERIVAAFRRAVALYGIPLRLYVDNGKDFIKAVGRRDRYISAQTSGVTAFIDDETFATGFVQPLGIEPVFARPYNAQAKAVERFFGTLVAQHWEGSPAYVGKLGKRSDEANRIFNSPEELPTFSEFCEYMEAAIRLYNTTPHRGIGMRNRTPLEVLAAERPPRVNPDPLAFKLVFYRREQRTMDRNGCRVRGLVYRPTQPEILFNYQRQRVWLLINPDDITEAIFCNEKMQVISAAELPDLATHDTASPVTQRAIDEIESLRKYFRSRMKVEPIAARYVAQIEANYPAYLKEAADRQYARLEQAGVLAAAAGGAGVEKVVPVFSKIARDRRRAESLVSAPNTPPLPPHLEALADTVEDHTDRFLDAVLANQELTGFKPAGGAARFGREREEEAESVNDWLRQHREEVAEKRRLKEEEDRRRALGLCTYLTCERRGKYRKGELCREHFIELEEPEYAEFLPEDE